MNKFIRNCIITLLGALFFMSSTCDPGYEFESRQHVVVNNQTDEDIMIFSMIDNYQSLVTENLKTIYYYRTGTNNLSANSATLINHYFRLDDKGMPLFSDMLLIMIIRRSTLDKYPLGYLIENNIYDDMFLLSYDELKLTNFEIIYKGRNEE